MSDDIADSTAELTTSLDEALKGEDLDPEESEEIAEEVEDAADEISEILEEATEEITETVDEATGEIPEEEETPTD